jgi:hypothetical protein
MDDIKIALKSSGESDSGPHFRDAAGARQKSRAALLYAALAMVAVWPPRCSCNSASPDGRSGLTLRQLTQDSGLTPSAISPDGKLVAYASTRSGEGNLDIWVNS